MCHRSFRLSESSLNLKVLFLPIGIKQSLEAIVEGAAALFLISFTASLVANVLKLNISDISLQSSDYSDGLLFAIFIGGIVVPIFEELIFRGILFNYFKKYSLIFGYIGSSFLFAIFHFAGISASGLLAILTAFAGAIVFVWTFRKSGTLVVPILLHTLANTITILFVLTS